MRRLCCFQNLLTTSFWAFDVISGSNKGMRTACTEKCNLGLKHLPFSRHKCAVKMGAHIIRVSGKSHRLTSFIPNVQFIRSMYERLTLLFHSKINNCSLSRDLRCVMWVGQSSGDIEVKLWVVLNLFVSQLHDVSVAWKTSSILVSEELNDMICGKYHDSYLTLGHLKR